MKKSLDQRSEFFVNRAHESAKSFHRLDVAARKKPRPETGQRRGARAEPSRAPLQLRIPEEANLEDAAQDADGDAKSPEPAAEHVVQSGFRGKKVPKFDFQSDFFFHSAKSAHKKSAAHKAWGHSSGSSSRPPSSPARSLWSVLDVRGHSTIQLASSPRSKDASTTIHSKLSEAHRQHYSSALLSRRSQHSQHTQADANLKVHSVPSSPKHAKK